MNDREEASPHRAFWKVALIGVLTGTVSSAFVTTAAYLYLRDNISGMVADGLSILNVQDTSGALSDISASCRELTGILAQPTTRPAQEILDGLRVSLKELKTKVNSVKTTEAYSVQDITELANQLEAYSDKKRIIDAHVGKQKRVVTGLAHINPLLASIEELIESLDRQMRQEPHVDQAALREGLAIIETTAAAAQAGLESRQTATLLTLEKFGKER